jgi:hypothetical protein
MLEDNELQYRFAKRAVEQKLSVHALEKLISLFLDSKDGEEAPDSESTEEAALRRQEERVAKFLGLEQVALRLDAQGRRRLNLVFETEAAWKRFMAKIRE